VGSCSTVKQRFASGATAELADATRYGCPSMDRAPQRILRVPRLSQCSIDHWGHVEPTFDVIVKKSFIASSGHNPDALMSRVADDRHELGFDRDMTEMSGVLWVRDEKILGYLLA
jgi:hypothetical protein